MAKRTVVKKLPKVQDTRKVVINACFGGFGLSYKGLMAYAEKKGIHLYAFVDARKPEGHLDFDNHVPYHGENEESFSCVHYATSPLVNGKYKAKTYFSPSEIERDDPALVAVVEELGKEACGWAADLRVVEIPADVVREIDEYDGNEHVQEQCRKWC